MSFFKKSEVDPKQHKDAQTIPSSGIKKVEDLAKQKAAESAKAKPAPKTGKKPMR